MNTTITVLKIERNIHKQVVAIEYEGKVFVPLVDKKCPTCGEVIYR